MPANRICPSAQRVYNIGFGIEEASVDFAAHIDECEDCAQAFDDGLEAQRRAIGIDEVDWDEMPAPANWRIS